MIPGDRGSELWTTGSGTRRAKNTPGCIAKGVTAHGFQRRAATIGSLFETKLRRETFNEMTLIEWALLGPHGLRSMGTTQNQV